MGTVGDRFYGDVMRGIDAPVTTKNLQACHVTGRRWDRHLESVEYDTTGEGRHELQLRGGKEYPNRGRHRRHCMKTL